MKLFDMSSIYRMYSIDKTYNLNISIYLGTIYLNIFKDKKLATKINLSQSAYLLLCESLNDFIIEEKSENKYKLTVTFNFYDMKLKRFIIDKTISYVKDIEQNKYKPYTIQITVPKDNIDVPFIISGNLNYSITRNNDNPTYTDPTFILRYYKYIFTKKIANLLNLSLENELMQKRKQQYKC